MAGRYAEGERSRQHGRAAGKPHGLLFLVHAAIALRGFLRHPLKHDIALAVLRKDGKAQFADKGAHRGLHDGPKPGRAKIKTIVAGFSVIAGRQYAPADTVPRFQQNKIGAVLAQQAACAKAGKAGADNRDLPLH